MAERHPFLSDEWIAEATRIRDEYKDRVEAHVQAMAQARAEPEGEAQADDHGDAPGTAQPGTAPYVIRMNQVITDVPFGEGTVNAHMDNTSGAMQVGSGHLENPDVTVSTDYVTAKSIFVDGNQEVAMQAFMAGKIKVQGDLAKLLAMQQAPAGPLAAEVQQRIRDVTA